MSSELNLFATDSPGNDEQDAQQGSCYKCRKFPPNALKYC